MGMTPFKKLNFKDQDLVTVQENVGRALDPIINNPLLDGILLTDILLPPAGKYVEHKLGRNWRGYIVTRSVASSGYSLSAPTSTYDRSKFLYLTHFGVANITLDIWVF